MTRWQLEPILNNYWLIGGLAITLLALLIMLRPFNDLDRRRQAILGTLRGIVIGLIVLAMLRPTMVRTETRDQRSTLIWLIDQSRSMLIPDADANRTRWEAVQAVLSKSEPELAKLGEKFDVQLYTFDEAAHRLERSDDWFDLPGEPIGKQTDIGSSLYDVVRSQRGSRIAGVLLLSDGAQRALAPRFNLQQPASLLARLDAPLYTVTLGQPRDRSQARDVAVENVQDQYSVFVNNEFSLTAGIRIDGLAGHTVPVVLEIKTPNGKTEKVGPIDVVASNDGEPSPARFEYTPREEGQYKLIVRAEKQHGELVTANNQLTSFLTVLGGGLRVLYLHGNLAWQEHKFIRRSLDSAPEIQLDLHWIDPRRRAQWPIDLQSVIGPNKYDVFMVGDVDFAALGSTNCRWLAKRIEQGNGFMMLGGAHSFGPGGYYQSVLGDVLPVRMGQLERQTFGQQIRSDVHITRELQMVPSDVPHFVTHLGSREQNEARWRLLPPLLGANRFRGLKPRGAVVLAETENDDPLLVAGEYGRGRVLAFAADSTYRWFRRGKQAEHKRFWRQAVLWLAKKEESDAQDVWVRLSRRRYPEGAQIEFELGARNSDGDPVDNATFQVVVIPPNQTETKVPVTRNEEQDGAGEDSWRGFAGPFESPGDYSLRVTAMRNDKELGSRELGTVERQFAIQATDQELIDPAANPAQLEMLAKLTEDAGGRPLAPEEVPALIDQIGKNPPNAEIEYQAKSQLTDSRTGAWGLFLVVIGLLSTEWFLRKKWGLV